MIALPPEKSPVTPCIEGCVRLGAGLDGCRRSRLPSGFDSRPVQTVASRYTDHAIPAQGTQRMCSVEAFSDPLVYYGPPDTNIPPVYVAGLPTERLYHKTSTLASTVQISSVSQRRMT